MSKPVRPCDIIAQDTQERESFPPLAAAYALLDQASNAREASAARDAIYKAELQHDIERGFTNLWDEFGESHKWQQARAFGLLPVEGKTTL